MEETQSLTKAERKAQRKEEKHAQQAAVTHKQKLQKVLWWGIGAGIAVLLVFLGYSRYIPVTEAEKQKPVNQVLENDWYKGNKDAKVVVVEYSDFQCPACQLYSPMIRELAQKYGDKIVIVYRHFPLKQIHLQAELAATAAEAAGKQGKFWEMNELLFERQEQWAEKREAKKLFIGYAKELGLDEARFKRDLISKEVKGLVKADYLSGLTNRLNSTPSFFVNGERVINPQGAQAFSEILDQKLQEATNSGQTTK